MAATLTLYLMSSMKTSCHSKARMFRASSRVRPQSSRSPSPATVLVTRHLSPGLGQDLREELVLRVHGLWHQQAAQMAAIPAGFSGRACGVCSLVSLSSSQPSSSSLPLTSSDTVKASLAAGERWPRAQNTSASPSGKCRVISTYSHIFSFHDFHD